VAEVQVQYVKPFKHDTDNCVLLKDKQVFPQMD